MDSYLCRYRFDWKSKNSEFWSRERWRNSSARWHHPHQYPELEYIKISEFWKSSQLASRLVLRSLHSEISVWLGWGCLSFCVCSWPLQILSLSLSLSLSIYLSLLLLYAAFTSNHKWLFIVYGEFLFLSGQQPGTFVPTDHPDRQKKFRVDCVVPCQWIFQIQRGHRQDW